MRIMDRVWWDGRMVSKREACLPCASPGVLYGQGLFETMRYRKGRVFFFARHLERLVRGSAVMGIPAPSRKRMRAAVRGVIEKNSLKEGAVRLNLCAGEPRPHLFAFVRPLPDLGRKRTRGLSVHLERGQFTGQTFLAGAKSFNRFFYERLFAEARARGFDEVFFLNGRGEVVEGSRSNIFVVKSGRVRTPALRAGCLPGVARAVAIEGLRAEKVLVREAVVRPRDLFSADEIFCTNALWGVVAVTRLDRRRIGPGRPGPVTQKSAQIYDKMVEKER